ncbi:MAG: methyltransferase domain-containing protein [Candidatus Komeilibacteria bacterium]|nr:methyltransferase domain-containing protein [Candidatus Komeilibacteria bacterium]
MSESEKLLQSYAKLARYYDTDNPPVWQEIKDLLSDIPSLCSVLDIGCGTGRIRQVLPDNLDYIGLDNSPELLQIAGRNFPDDKFIVADARELPFPDKSFDAVLVIATVHHFLNQEDRLAVLKEARRVLKNGGQLYLSVWNLNRPKFWRQWRGWRKVVIPNQHNPKIRRIYFAYTQTQLRHELESSGFNIESIGLKGQNIVVQARG